MGSIIRNNIGPGETGLLIRSIVESISKQAYKPLGPTFNVSREHATRILDAALRNDVFYPAYVALRESVSGKIATKRNSFENLSYQYLAANAVWLTESYRVLRLFVENDLRVMPMKGFLLAHFYYPNKLMRFAWDTDLLFVSEREKMEAERLLLQDKFHVDYSSPLETKLTKRFSRFSVHIETHSCPGSLMYAFEFPKWNDLWANSARVTIAGSAVDVMQPEDALLVSCVSVCSRGMLTAKDFLDLRQIIRTSKSFRWDIIAGIGRKSIWRHILLIPLHLVDIIAKIYLNEALVPKNVFEDLARYGEPDVVTNLPTIARMIERAGLPVDYRDILYYIGYARSPLLANFLLWPPENPTLIKRILRVFVEALNILTVVRREHGDRYAVSCLRSWFSAYVAKFSRKRFSENLRETLHAS